MSVDAPRFPHLRHPDESLRHLAETAKHRWREILLTFVLAVGTGGTVKVTSDYIASQSLRSGMTVPQPDNGFGVTLVPTPTARPEATITAVSVGGLEPGAPKSRYGDLFYRISKGQASEAEIREFNNLATEQNTVTTWQTEKGEIRQLPQIEGLRAMYYVANNRLETVYVTQGKNPYELKEGSIAGVFNPNVSIENKQTGGVVMVAPVVLKLMETNTKGLGLPLPLDVSKGQITSISFLETEISGMYRSYMILNVSGKTPLTNILPDENELKIGKSIIKDANGQALWQYGIVGSVIDDPKKIRPFKPYVLFPSKIFPNNVITVQKRFGDIVDEIEGSEERLSYGNGTKVQTLTNNDILTAEEAPVFLAVNTP